MSQYFGRGMLICTLMGSTTLPVFADACANLSYERNAIYKAAGYCFHTAAQIRIFGNAGCAYDDQNDVPLSARQRAQIADLVRSERDLGCR